MVTEQSQGERRAATSGPWLVVVAAILWSTSGMFAKAPLFDDWPLAQRGLLLAFWRALFASLVLLPLVRRPAWSPRLIPMTLVFAAMNLAFLTAMVQTTAANAIWLQNTAPVWVFLIGVFLLGESRRQGDLLLVGFGTLGVGVILVFELQGQASKGILFGLLGGITYAGVILSLRQLRAFESAWLIALNHLVTTFLLLPYVLYQNIWPNRAQLACLAGFGIFQMGLPYWLFARGLRSISGHEASGIALLEPVLVPVWVYLAWHQSSNYQAPRWWTLLGGGLILVGIALRFLGTWKRRRLRRSGP